MPQKPLDQLTPSYRKRIERGLAKGKSRQEARGKKAGEHIIRKQKEIAQGKFTSSQMQAIKKFVKKQAYRGGDVFDSALETFLRILKQNYSFFNQIKAEQKQLEKEYSNGHPIGRPGFNDILKRYGFSDKPEYFFYYH